MSKSFIYPDNNATTPFWLQPESRRLEFKEIWPSGDKIAQTAIAFANGAGGKIMFGIKDEPREVVGVPDLKELKQRFFWIRPQ